MTTSINNGDPSAPPNGPQQVVQELVTDEHKALRREAAALTQRHGISLNAARAVQHQVLLHYPELTGIQRESKLEEAAQAAARSASAGDAFVRSPAGSAVASIRQTSQLSTAVLSQVAFDPTTGPVLPLPKNDAPQTREVQALLPKFANAQAVANLPNLPPSELGGQVNWTALVLQLTRQIQKHYSELGQQLNQAKGFAQQARFLGSITQADLVRVQIDQERSQTLLDSANRQLDTANDVRRETGGRLTGSNPTTTLESLDLDLTKQGTDEGGTSARAPKANLARSKFIHDLASGHALSPSSSPDTSIGVVSYPGGPPLKRFFLATDEQSLLQTGQKLAYDSHVTRFSATHLNSLLVRKAIWEREQATLTRAAGDARAASQHARAAGDESRSILLNRWAEVHSRRAADIRMQAESVYKEIALLEGVAHSNGYGVAESQVRQRESIAKADAAQQAADKAGATTGGAVPAGLSSAGNNAQQKIQVTRDDAFAANSEVIEHAKILADRGSQYLAQWKTSILQEGYNKDIQALEDAAAKVGASGATSAQSTEAKRQFDLARAKVTGIRQSVPPQIRALLDLTLLSQSQSDRIEHLSTAQRILTQQAPDKSLVDRHFFALSKSAKAQMAEAERSGNKTDQSRYLSEAVRLEDQRRFIHTLIAQTTQGSSSSGKHAASFVSSGYAPSITTVSDVRRAHLDRFDNFDIPTSISESGTPQERADADTSHRLAVTRAEAQGAAFASPAFFDKSRVPAKIVQKVAEESRAFGGLVGDSSNSAQGLAAGAAGLAESLAASLDGAFLGKYAEARGLIQQLNAIVTRSQLWG